MSPKTQKFHPLIKMVQKLNLCVHLHFDVKVEKISLLKSVISIDIQLGQKCMSQIYVPNGIVPSFLLTKSFYLLCNSTKRHGIRYFYL